MSFPVKMLDPAIMRNVCRPCRYSFVLRYGEGTPSIGCTAPGAHSVDIRNLTACPEEIRKLRKSERARK